MTAPPCDALLQQQQRPCVVISSSKRRRLRDRRVAVRHALVHTQKLKQSLRGIDGECTSISDVSPLDGFVMSSEPGLKKLDIVDNMRRMKEKLNIVAAYVLTQSNIISESLAYRPVAAERLLESMGIEGDGSLSNSTSGDDGQTANISTLQGE